MDRKSCRDRGEKLPDLGDCTPKVVEYFERALQGKNDLKKKIKRYEGKLNPSVRDLLELAYFRNELELIGPPLPSGDVPAGMRLWIYWIDHDEDLRRYTDLRDDLRSYLLPPERIEKARSDNEVAMHDVVSVNKISRLAFYTIVEEMFASPGRPVTRRPTAVQALQMKIDGKTWKEITDELCDCRKGKHDRYCLEMVRQSVITLKKQLRAWNIAVPKY